ncbi:epsin-2 [Monosporozyma servazzii]
MSKQFVRSAKNVMKGYSSTQVLVRDATSNDDRVPHVSLLEDIARASYDNVEFYEVMDIIDKRLNDKPKYWKHIEKCLTLLDYLVRFGSENCIYWCKDNMLTLKQLRDFRYFDESGFDQGQIIRVKSIDLVNLINDEPQLTNLRRFNKRRHRKSNRNDNLYQNPRRQREDDDDYGSNVDSMVSNRMDSNRYSRPNSRPPSRRTTQDVDLQKAIEESKRTAEEDERRRKELAQYDEADPELLAALQLSKEEEELKELQDLQRLQQQQQQQQIGFQQPQQNGFYDIFGNQISQTEYQEYQQQQQSWEQQQQQQRLAQEQYLQQQQQQQQQEHQLAIQQDQEKLFAEQQQQMALQQQQQMALQQQQQMALQQQQTSLPLPQDPNQFTMQQGPPPPQQQPMVTGSNNPFALNSPVQTQPPAPQLPAQVQQTDQPQQYQSVPQEQQNFQSPPPQFVQSPSQQQQPLKQIKTGNQEITNQYSELNNLIAQGTGIDTYGNTGELRIPAQHTATGTFINSQGTGYRQESNSDPKNNPFVNTQYTGLPSASNIVPSYTGYGFGNQTPDHDNSHITSPQDNNNNLAPNNSVPTPQQQQFSQSPYPPPAPQQFSPVPPVQQSMPPPQNGQPMYNQYTQNNYPQQPPQPPQFIPNQTGYPNQQTAPPDQGISLIDL